MSDTKPTEAARRLAVELTPNPYSTVDGTARHIEDRLGLREIEEAMQRVKLAADMDTGTWNLVESALARLRGEKTGRV